MTAVIISGSSKANVEKSAQQLVYSRKNSDEVAVLRSSRGSYQLT